MGIGHHGRAAFLAADGDFDIDVDQCVEHGEKAFAWHAEDVFDAMGDQLADEDLPASAG